MKIIESDLMDAIQHIDTSGDQGFILSDFRISELGTVPLSWLLKQDDSAPWIEVDPAEFKDLSLAEKFKQLEEFRGANWVEIAKKWISSKEIPPVVIITAPTESEKSLITVIGDGRGRINLALALGLRFLPAVRMTYKKPLLPKNAALQIEALYTDMSTSMKKVSSLSFKQMIELANYADQRGDAYFADYLDSYLF